METTIFDNGIDDENIGFIKKGFLSALVEDAEGNLRDSEPEDLGFTQSQYDELKDYGFSTKNISPEAVEKCGQIVDDFTAYALDDSQREKVNAMNREEQIGFGINLYQSLLYDYTIIGKEFCAAVSAARTVDESGHIGESVDGDIRIFFE